MEESIKVGYATNLMIVFFNLIPIQVAGGFVWDGKNTHVEQDSLGNTCHNNFCTLILDALF